MSETLTPTSTDYFSAVQAAIADALGIDESEAVAEATLLGQASGAESIDLLDILFRIERATKVKITVADIAAGSRAASPTRSSVTRTRSSTTPASPTWRRSCRSSTAASSPNR